MKLQKKQYLNIYLKDLNFVTKDIIKNFKDIKIWLFEGEMGAGKTTLIRYLCDNFGIEDFVDSPTYNIVNEYRIFKKRKNEYSEYIYHFDLYRLNTTNDLLDIDIFRYINSNNYCFFEWPSKLRLLRKNVAYNKILNKSILLLNITSISIGTRNIFLTKQVV